MPRYIHAWLLIQGQSAHNNLTYGIFKPVTRVQTGLII